MTRHTLYFRPGDDETRIFRYLIQDTTTVIPITGYTSSFVATVGDVTLNVTGIVDGPNGTVTVPLTHVQTTALGAAGVEFGEYDLKIVSSGGAITTIAEGPIVLDLTP